MQSYVTGTDGRFWFDNLPAGKFALSATRRSAPTEFFRDYEGYSTAIATGPGLKSTEIVFPLTMPASISGTVTAEENEPVRRAQVWLFRRGVAQGKFQTRSESVQGTDAAGHFHFDRLKPGVYLVAVQARPWYAQNGLNQEQESAYPDLDVAYPTTYFGGSTDPNSASPLNLVEGDSVSIEINLRAEHAIHVQVNDPRTEKHDMPMLSTLGPDGFSMPVSAGVYNTENRLVITGIPAGRYVIAVRSKIANGGAGARKTLDLTADSSIDLSDLADDPVEHPNTPGGQDRVKGGSAIEGVAMRDGQPYAGAMVLAVPADRSNVNLLRRDQSDSDGTFSLPNAAPGRYTIVAIDNGRDLAYAEAGVLDPYLNNGRALDVPVAGGPKIQVEVLSRRR